MTSLRPSLALFMAFSGLGPVDTVDIYDVSTGQWNSTSTGAGSLGVARYLLAAAATGSKVVFAGG